MITGRAAKLDNPKSTLYSRYHQKYRLQNNWQLFRDLKHLTGDELKTSLPAARLNGLAAGIAQQGVIQQEISHYGLSQQTQDHVLDLLSKISS